jgi:hypothetical protein
MAHGESFSRRAQLPGGYDTNGTGQDYGYAEQNLFYHWAFSFQKTCATSAFTLEKRFPRTWSLKKS